MVTEKSSMTSQQSLAEAALQERGYDIISCEEVQRQTEEALNAGEFVSGYDELMASSNEWVEDDDDRLSREFYHRTPNYPQGEYAKAIAVFSDGELYDFYVEDHSGVEI
jgi:hypothetical protein